MKQKRDKNNTSLTIRLPSDAKAILRKKAEREGKSIAQVVRDAAIEEKKE